MDLETSLATPRIHILTRTHPLKGYQSFCWLCVCCGATASAAAVAIAIASCFGCCSYFCLCFRFRFSHRYSWYYRDISF
jgi:hypothetical protein